MIFKKELLNITVTKQAFNRHIDENKDKVTYIWSYISRSSN